LKNANVLIYRYFQIALAIFAVRMTAFYFMKEVTIVCDGSSLGNGKGNPRAAAVAILGYKGFWRAFGIYLGNATNQQAEIAAATIGLEKLSEPCKVRVLSDSRYVVETMTGNFRKKTNHEWWEKLERASKKHQIKWEWIKGHAGHEVQEIVDTLARKTAELGKVDEVMFDEAAAEIGVKEI
jgi:ribonuclease HI